MADFTKEEREQYELFLKEFFEAGERNYLAHSLHQEIAALRAQLEQAQGESGAFRDLLEQHGFRRCDMAACACGSWHHVEGFAARFREIEEATDDYWINGETLLARVERIVATIARQRAWIESAGHRPGCKAITCQYRLRIDLTPCGQGDFEFPHVNTANPHHHKFQPGPCDCGYAELVK